MIRIDHNLTPTDLIYSLAGLAHAEGVEEPLILSLRQHDRQREPCRERYLRDLGGTFAQAGGRLDELAAENLARAVHGILELPEEPVAKSSRGPRILGSRRRRGLLLTPDEIAELLDLIRTHYRVRIRGGGVVGGGGGITPAQERRWKALGVIRPDVQLAGLVEDAFLAGRLESVLTDGNSLEDMRRMARAIPISREASLTLRALQERVAYDLAGGVGYRAEQHAGELVLGINARRINEIAAAYRRGDLRHTPTNRDDLSPEEVAATETATAVRDWRGLGRELRNRMARDDRNRDWERVAVSVTRQSANIGAIGAMAESGVEELYYDVHTDACTHCKRLYLEPDGTPKIFPVAQLMATIDATGGANYGRRASQIGDPAEGWVPNALAHPWCQCRPKRRIRGVTPQARRSG